MVTIIDVAKAAGVSKTTVSAVVNNTSVVKDKTRKLVLDTIERMGYVPNVTARSLITHKTNILGAIVGTEDDDNSYEFDKESHVYSQDVINGMPKGLENTDYGLLTERICLLRQEEELPKILKQNRVDGVCLIGALFSNQFIDKIKEMNIPMVGIGKFYDGIDSIMPDVEDSSYIVSKYLFEMGHRNICYVNCSPLFESSKDRLNGLHRAAEEYGIRINSDWIVYAKENTGKSGYLTFKSLWESGARPEGIITANASITLGVIRYLYEQNVRIPGDISIVGYEDSVLGGYASPALTATNVCKEFTGEQAIKLLLNRIKHPTSELQRIKVKTKLVIRESVADRRKR